MNTFIIRNIKYFGKTVLSMAVLGGFLLIPGAPRAFADGDDCQHRVAKADHKLHEAIEHHGGNSKQAAHARQELHQARESCWNRYHKWWDEDGHRWHTDRDWDDHDHDQDREHH
jgi:hypothetical protein